MMYVYPVTQSPYPTFYIQQAPDSAAERNQEIVRLETAADNQRPNEIPYQSSDDARGHYLDILA